MNRNWWKLLEDIDVQGDPMLELAEFLKEGEVFVTKDTVFGRAVQIGNRAGLQHAKRLLAQKDAIPEEWRSFHLLFLGTRWYLEDGSQLFPELSWYSDDWRLAARFLDDFFNFQCRLVCYKEAA